MQIKVKYDLDDHHSYQDARCSELSDSDLILGMVAAYRRDVCDADHASLYRSKGHLPTDECRMFLYVSGPSKGMSDHFNMRWFREWCEKNRPQVIKRLYELKSFW